MAVRTEMRADEHFAERLLQMRRRLALAQRELGDLAGLPRETVGRWERGVSRPYAGEAVRRVCGILRCRPDWLLWGVED